LQLSLKIVILDIKQIRLRGVKMKKKKILITVALVATMLSSLVACKSGQTNNDNGQGGNNLKNATFVFLSQDTEENMRDKVKYAAFATAVENFEKKYNGKVEFIYSPWAEKQGKLAALMAAGTPPDLYAPIDGYPQFAINGHAQPIDDLINLKDPIWKDVLDAYEATSWKGKHHFAIVNKGPLDVVWYNKSIFENNGLETPYELYKSGNWNWETFRDLAIKLTQDTTGDKVIDQWGYSMPGPEALFGTVGKDLVKIDGKAGTMENNLKDPDIINAFTFFQESGPAKHNIIVPNLNAYMEDFGKGKIAMHVGAIWSDVVWWKEMMQKSECSFVPAPKYPNSSDYYVAGSADIYMIPQGAPNAEASAAFLAELRKAHMDPEVRKLGDDALAKDRGWGAQEFEMRDELEKLKYGYSFFAGVGTLGSDRYGLWYELRVQGQPVQTAIEGRWNVWNNEIDLATGKITIVRNEVTASPGKPVIDGDIDDIWKDAQEIVTDQEKGAEDIATAKVKLLYDEDTLYILAQVSDSNIMNSNENPWECDSIEIFIDENKAQGNSYDENTIQLRVGADGKVTGGGPAFDGREAEITSAVKKVDGGYIVEIAYKFKGVKAKSGSSMGFNVSVNDQEEVGSRKGTAVWNPDGGSSWQNPSKFGIVNFK
jgi:ABC-type glycerol-3-phosphate transport system substrate-binding protein